MKNPKYPRWSKLNWAQLKNDPALRLCSLAAQGLWTARILPEMDEATPYGHLVIKGKALSVDDLAILVGRPAEEIAPLIDELERRGVFSRRSDLDKDPEFRVMFRQIEAAGMSVEADQDAIVNRCMIRTLINYQNGQKGGKASAGTGKSLHNLKPFNNLAGGVLGTPERRSKEEVPLASLKGDEPSPEGDVIPEMKATDPEPDQPQPGLFPEDTSPKKPERPENPHAKALFSEGMDILAETQRAMGRNPTEAQLRALLGKMRKEARSDDVRLLDLLRESRDKADALAWVKAALLSKPPRVIVNNDPNDRCGIQAWCERRKFAPTTDESDRKLGKWIAKLGNSNPIIDNVARKVADGARLPSSFVPDWDVLADWIASGIPHANIVTSIAKAATQEIYDPKGIRSLRYFNGWVGYRAAA